MVLRFKKPAQSIDTDLRRAIAERKLIELRYKDCTRIAEPHDYGRQHAVDRLLIYQLTADSARTRHETGWRLLDIPKIESLRVLNTTFRGSRQQPHQDHHHWEVLYARVEG